MSTSLPPGSTIGILGGGQLGQMLSLAASRLGFRVHILAPEDNPPASRVSEHHVKTSYDDLDAVLEFANNVDVVTYEFENVPANTAKAAQAGALLYPGAEALRVAQDRLVEKTFISKDANVAVTPFENVTSVFDLKRACKKLGLPLVLKTRRFGYDGKGQIIIRNEEDIESAYSSMNGAPTIAEAFIPFKREVSVVAARNAKGEIATYPLIENVHKDHILHISSAPAKGEQSEAQAMARRILEALDYVGVMAVEFFEMDDGSLIVNEIAPRVHNSGHWTQDAGCVDQFELHIRAITGWPLGSTTPTHSVQMLNLIGDDADKWEAFAADPLAKIHLYGKSEARPGRKMGHINRKIN